MVACTCSAPASTNRSTQSRCGDSRAGLRKPKVCVCASLRRVSSAAWSHSRRTAARAAPVAVKERLRKSSCSSSASRRRMVASSTSESSRPRRARAQSTRATGSGTRVPRAQRRTASAAATGSSVQSPSGRSSWPIVASSLSSAPGAGLSRASGRSPPPGRSPPGGRSSGGPTGAVSPAGPSRPRSPPPCPRARCTAPRRPRGALSADRCVVTASTRDSATRSRATYSTMALPRSMTTSRGRVCGARGKGQGAGDCWVAGTRSALPGAWPG